MRTYFQRLFLSLFLSLFLMARNGTGDGAAGQTGSDRLTTSSDVMPTVDAGSADTVAAPECQPGELQGDGDLHQRRVRRRQSYPQEELRRQ
jgi:hypothetical protein